MIFIGSKIANKKMKKNPISSKLNENIPAKKEKIMSHRMMEIMLIPISLYCCMLTNNKIENNTEKGVNKIPFILRTKLSIPSIKHCFKEIIDKIKYKTIKNIRVVSFFICFYFRILNYYKYNKNGTLVFVYVL